jgi:hypothetical protein
MAGLNSGQVRIAGTGHLVKAPLGTVLPTDSTTAWDPAFVDLGYATDGFTMAQALKTLDITAWQTLEPVRTVNTSLIRNFTFELLQTNRDTLALSWGGATITPSSNVSLGTVAIAITTGVLTVSATETLVVGDAVVLGTVTGAAPLVAGVTYYVKTAPTGTTLTLAATLGGTAIATTAAGTSTSITKVTSAYTLAIPDPSSVTDFILGIDWSDGTLGQRIILQKAHQDVLPTIKSVRTDGIRYAISVQANKPSDGSNSVLVYGVDSAMTS